MLGLRDEISRDVLRIRRVVGDDRDLGRAGLGIDGDEAADCPFGCDDVDVARAADEVHRLAQAVDAVGEHADGLRTTRGIDLVDAKHPA